MDDQFEPKTETFLKWLNHIGVQISSKAELTDLRAHGRGRALVAKGDFAEDELIFSVPRTSTLSVKAALPELLSDRQDISAEDINAMPNWAALTAVMITEGLRPDSKWAPYFNVLPTKLDSLVFWGPEELAELQASAVLKKVGKSKAEEIFHESILRITPEGANVDLFHRVASTIMAYAFDIPENEQEDEENANEDELVDDDEQKTSLAMIPLADMLNADADNNARLHYDGEELEMRTIKAIQSGEEILNDYGQLPRSDLLRRYGYVTDKYAPFDVAEVSTSSITDHIYQDLGGDLKVYLGASEIEARLELAKREDVYEDAYDVGHATEEWPCIPDELVALVYLLLVGEETLAAIQSSKMSLPSRSKLETELVGKALQRILERREREYATTVTEDENLLQAGNHSNRVQMAIQMRMGEKLVLKEAKHEAGKFQGDNKRMLGRDKREREDDEHVSQKKSRHR
ncbi:hypothetical protein V493_07452 [Pseudogymnoascus sp. VKM F-4281 (FW-2241)]|nr:hypothetical protein V493_07452 [Pseudogymnoascus sp. VKM F-4281 (FW-2241)]